MLIKIHNSEHVDKDYCEHDDKDNCEHVDTVKIIVFMFIKD